MANRLVGRSSWSDTALFTYYTASARCKLHIVVVIPARRPLLPTWSQSPHKSMATRACGFMATRGVVVTPSAASTASSAANTATQRRPFRSSPSRHRLHRGAKTFTTSTTTTTRSAYGESQPDGTWVPIATNAFGNLINLAKGQREIVQAGTPCLRDIAEEVPVQDIDSATIQELIQEMLSICRGRGVGLAAPQIGVPYRIFVLEDTEEGMSDVGAEDLAAQERVPFAAKVVVNPVVTPMSDASAAFFEGCLSVQGYRGLVRRWLQVGSTGVHHTAQQVYHIPRRFVFFSDPFARLVARERERERGAFIIR